MGPSYATVIVPIADGEAEALRALLTTRVDPQPGPDDALVCQPLFPFDALPMLHFMSFLVIDADREEQLPAQLVLDATFDGERGAFLRALVGAAGPGLREIYGHCVGVPDSLSDFPRYLAAHDVGADAFYSGSFGRSVGQIRQEHGLRAALQGQLDAQRARPLPQPASNAGLLASLQAFVRETPAWRWAMSAPEVPWPMQYRTQVGCALAGGIAVAVALLGGVLLALCGVDFGALHAAVRAAPAWATALGTATPVAAGLALLALAVVGARWAEIAGSAAADSSKPHPPLLDAIGFLALPVRAWTFAAFVVVVGLVACELVVAGVLALPDAARREIDALRATLLGGTAPGYLRSAIVAVGCLLALGVVAHLDSTLRLQLARMPRWRVTPRLLLQTALSMAKAVLLGLLLAALLAPWATSIAGIVAGIAAIIASVGMLLLAFLAGLVFVYILLAILLIVVRLHERKDLDTYCPASELTNGPMGNRGARAREEGGINALQNHLASVTYVKPGRFRLAALTLTLAAIGLLARIWYNQGALGGIATILSARWVVIDNGRRLVFLDNYGGGWESYLNEFIDMSAVTGLNAIWTNTFIKWPRPQQGEGTSTRYAFPATRFYTSDGARAERPFKAYVRYSQIETLAWYGAYHRQSITNVNANSRIRRDLFRPLPSHEVDRLVGKL